MANEDFKAERNSLVRVQDFDVATLARREDLGREFSFEGAIEPAKRAIALFKLIPEDMVSLLPVGTRNQLKNSADSLFNIFTQIDKFSAQTPNAYAERQAIINSLSDNYESWFNQLTPALVFSTSTQRDFTRIEQQARAAAQAATDEAENLTKKLSEHQQEAERVLAEVRKVAAEQGVGFQATYFRSEADSHDKLATTWNAWTLRAAAGLGILAVLSLFMHQVSIFAPTNTYETVQIVVAKLVIFGAVGYLVVLCARNFLAHTHNAIVNRHRQNALLTFQALVNAANGEDKKDIVLTHASACMFAPQETGFTKPQAEGGPNLVQLLGKFPAEKIHGN